MSEDDAGVITGFAAWKTPGPLYGPNRWLMRWRELSFLVVEPEHRGCGLGRHLLEHSQTVLAEESIQGLYTSFASRLTPWYEGVGWTVGRRGFGLWFVDVATAPGNVLHGSFPGDADMLWAWRPTNETPPRAWFVPYGTQPELSAVQHEITRQNAGRWLARVG